MNTGYLEIGTENIFKTAFTSELCTLLQENLSYSSAKSTLVTLIKTQSLIRAQGRHFSKNK